MSTTIQPITVKISVRNLVEFIFRSGDITSSGKLRDPYAMQEGTRIHQKLQNRMGSKYQAEVFLSLNIPLHVEGDIITILTDAPKDHDISFSILLEGRADGIFPDKTGMIIDEIKGVYRDIFSMQKPETVHLAQALCYAYIYAKKEQLETIGVRMTYCHIPSEKTKYFIEQKNFSELEMWFFELIRNYAKWCIWKIRWQEKRNASIKETDFPFPYRPGQADLVKDVYRSILRKKRLYIEAPTGVGKTISTVFPAVKSIGESVTEKIFYLTAKTITRTVAENTFSLLEQKGTALKCITITAKEKICVLDKPACHPDTCERAKGHFDRINDAIFDILTHETIITRATVFSYAEKHHVCPFEFSLDISLFADVVIGDYNYAFDPTASLKRFFSTETENDFVFLIDEAHNLVDRAREMYSATLVKEEFLAMKKMIKQKSKKIASSLDACNRAMLELKHLCETTAIYQTIQIDTLLLRLMRLMTLLEEILQNTGETGSSAYGEKKILLLPLTTEEKENLLNFYFTIREFRSIFELTDEYYTIYGDYGENDEFRLHLQCMDPANNLSAYLKKARCSVFFSATLLPIHYYLEQLAGRKDDYAIYAPSPFSTENRKLLIGKGVSTKYTLRGPEMYQKIVNYILKFISVKRGNYLVFFPSYQMLKSIQEYLDDEKSKQLYLEYLQASCHKENPHFPNKFSSLTETEKRKWLPEFHIQNTAMSEEERETFLSHFSENPQNTTVGLCVMGGIFGEGIDLKNNRLIGTVLVGTGLPMVCTENELFKDYFDKNKKDGFDYAYRYPGMNKVLQAAGRVIRTTEDRGAILLLDDRFLEQSYQKLFPREWFPYETVTADLLPEILADFWTHKS